MNKSYILAFAATALLFATSCTDKELLPQEEPDVTPSVPGDNQMSVTVKGLEDVFSWKSGDKITVIGENVSETFSILDPFSASKAKFSGKDMESPEYDIIYSRNGTTLGELEARSYEVQEQNGNGSTSHLDFDMMLEGVADYKNVAFSGEWAEENGGELKISNCIRLNLDLPSSILTLSSVRIECDKEIFYLSNGGDKAANSISITFPEAIDVAINDYEVTAYMLVSWKPVNITENETVKIFAEYGEDEYFAELPSMNLSLNGGVLLDITVPSEAWALYDTTPGSVLNPYYITTSEEMMQIPQRLAEGRTVYFNLKNDIDMSGKEWIPALVDGNSLKSMNFDGGGYKISNLSLDSESQYASFAGILDGTVKNVIFENPVIKSNIGSVSPAAVVAAQAGRPSGETYALIENVTVTGADLQVTQQQYSPAGIIAGSARGAVIKNCQVDGTVTHAGADAECNIGGFIGKIDEGCTVSGCKSDVDVTVNSKGRVFGGFIGSIRSAITVSDCVASGTLDACIGTMRYSGGLIGYLAAKAEIRNCSFTGDLIGGTDYMGGILGAAAKTVTGSVIDNCHFNGKIDMGADKPNGDGNVGGILGITSAPMTISDCTASGEISIGHKIGAVGGILGQIAATAENTLVERCRYDGDITNGANQSWFGGIVGIIRSAGTVRNCWTSGSISDANHSTGGIIGSLGKDSVVENCFSTMSILAKHAIGGIIGRADNYDNNASAAGWNIRISGCIAWNSSIKSLNMSAGGINVEKNLSGGAVIGRTDIYNFNENCYRRPDMVFECMDETHNEMYDQENSGPEHPLVLKHTGKYYMPYHGKVVAQGETISDIARKLGWDETVWDLSSDTPKLK